MRAKLIGGIWLIAAVLIAPAQDAIGIDLHRMWDDRCFECHGHAAEFARRSLIVSGGQLKGRHHVDDLLLFMSNHYLADSEIDAVYDMLLSQASSFARFKEDCANCHKSAADFARHSLEFRNDVLYGRVSGQPVRDFLSHHRRLDADDVNLFEGVLTRVANEVHRP